MCGQFLRKRCLGSTFSGCADCGGHVREGLGAILAVAGEDAHIAILQEMDLQRRFTRLSDHALCISSVRMRDRDGRRGMPEP